MSLEVQLRLAGCGLLLLGALHGFFPRMFAWKDDLRGVSLLNRQIFGVHTMFIGVTVMFFGILSFLTAGMLHDGGVLLAVLFGGFALFWLLRLYVQLFVFDRSLWRGRGRHTALHGLFVLLWSYLVFLYAWALLVVVR